MSASRPKRFFAWLILAWPLAAFSQWAPTNGPVGAVVTRLVTDGASLFAQTGEYPILQSKDRGATWRYVSSEDPAYFSGNMVARGDTLYHVDWRGVRIHPGAGSAWRSANTGLGTDTLVQDIAFGWGGLVIIADSGKVFQSPDQGGHWTRLDEGQGPWWTMTSPNVLALDGDCAYVAGSAGVRRSMDRGRTWSTGRPDTKDTSVMAVVTQPHSVFAMTELGVYRSRDSGASWVKLAVGGSVDSGGYASLAVLGSRLYAERFPGGLFSSSDAGESWNRDSVSPDLPVSFIDGGLVGIGDDLFAGSDFGVYRSSDLGHTWSGVNTGIGRMATRNLTAAGSGRLVATYSNQAFVSEDQGRQWKFLPGPSSFYITGAQGTLYCISSTDGLFRFSVGGTNWEKLYSVSELGAPIARTKFITLGPDLYFAGSTGAGTFLKLLSPPRAGQTLPDPPPWLPDVMALCSRVPYAIVYDSLLRYDEAGRQWKHMAAGPLFRTTVLGSQGSAILLGTNRKGLWRSADSGTTWSKVADSAAFGQIYDLLEIGESVFAATDSGVAVSRKGGAWSAMNQGFEAELLSTHGFQAIDRLNIKIVSKIAAQDGYLYATRDTGVWRIPVDGNGSGINSRHMAAPRKPEARWTLISGRAGFKGAPGEARRDARGRSLGKAPSAANPGP